jgi:lambda repressor-like predicted transcriptional regulator
MSWEPLSMRVIDLVRRKHNGLSVRQMSHVLNVQPETLSPILHRLYANGAPLEKLHAEHGPRVIWKWKRAETS